jgi:diguanylate cyclase (GGDEF)-like protein
MQKQYERLKLNRENEKKILEIETRILSMTNFKDFFENLLEEIKNQFKISYAWVSLIVGTEISEPIQSLGLGYTAERINIIARERFLELIGVDIKPLLINGDLKPYYDLFPQNSSYFIKSMAIAPICLNGTVVGSLNQADFSGSRFSPEINTDPIEYLALKVSTCLSNVSAHEKLKSLSAHDPLTGLLNRRVLTTILTREFKRNQRYSNDLSVLYLDLDNFARVNNIYGPDGGDNLLRFVAKILMKTIRNSDVVARYTENEFVIILPETKVKNALNLANRLQDYFKNSPLTIGNNSIPVSLSFGVTSTEDRSIKSPVSLIERAYEMLSIAKSNNQGTTYMSTEDHGSSKIIQLPIPGNGKGPAG